MCSYVQDNGVAADKQPLPYTWPSTIQDQRVQCDGCTSTNGTTARTPRVGDYMQHLQDNGGLRPAPSPPLTINHPKTSEFSATACSQYQWNDSTPPRVATICSTSRQRRVATTVTSPTINYPKTSRVQCHGLQPIPNGTTARTPRVATICSTSRQRRAATAPSPLHLTINYP